MNVLNIVKKQQQKKEAIQAARLELAKRNTCYLIKR